MRKTVFALFIAVFTAVLLVQHVDGKNTRRRLIKPSRRPVLTAVVEPSRADTITETSIIETLVRISDYQKTVRSRVESMLLTNLTGTDTIKSLTVDLNYTSTDGQQLNRREVTVTVTVPPGETRHVSFTSWDRQQLFYYQATPPSRPTVRTRPFHIAITPLALVLTH